MTKSRFFSISCVISQTFISLILNIGLLLLLLRFGLVAVMSWIIFINVPESLPVTLDQSLLYSSASICVLLFLAALAFCGFRTVLAGKPALTFDLLKE